MMIASTVVTEATTKLFVNGLANPPVWKACFHHWRVKLVTTSWGRSPNTADPGANDTMKMRYRGKSTSSTEPTTQKGKDTLSGTLRGSRLVRGRAATLIAVPAIERRTSDRGR